MGSLALSDIADDEWDVDFNDNRQFIETRWHAIQEQCRQRYSVDDYERAMSVPDVMSLGRYLKKIQNHNPDVILRNKTGEILEALGTFKQLTDEIDRSMRPQQLDFAVVWGSMILLIDSSLQFLPRYEKVVDVFSAIRRYMVRINLFVKTYQEEQRETRLAMVDALQFLVLLLVDIKRYIYEHPHDMSGWPRFEQDTIKTATNRINGVVKHLHELAQITSLTQDRQQRYLSYRDAQVTRAEDVDNTTYINIPRKRGDVKCHGREVEIEAIREHLDPNTATTLRTFTIYGRRGVGKTRIALEYAYRNPSKFHAIFWIGCETSSSLRNSFRDMARILKLGGVTAETHHEEVLMLCMKWLERTDRYWLLIFDNAEDEELLRIYWPAAKGAIMITSRQHVNFNNHSARKGLTIQPFDFQQSWELFVTCAEWENRLARHEIVREEIEAAEELVKEFKGLPLSIEQAAANLRPGRFTSTRDLLATFREAKQNVERRPSHVHSKTNHAIDSIWYVVFQRLENDAKFLLSILCLLSPDSTHIDVFQPKNQDMLTPFSEFCRRPAGPAAPLSPALQNAIKQLMDASLITRDGRILTIHRVVQEAFLFVNKQDHPTAFDAAARLVYAAFPNQVNGRPLQSQWERCERFIHEAISLCQKYREFKKYGEKISAPREFRWLLTNCAWFLFEVGDYGEVFPLIEVAKEVGGDDNSSLEYAHLRNTEGGCYFELNQLRYGRAAWEETLEIRTRKLSHDDEELANIINNMANLESAKGNFDQALELFERAQAVRMNAGDEAQSNLTLTLMGIGRTYEAMGRFPEAAAKYDEAEGLILQAPGERNMFMASLHYARGNLERALQDPHAARGSYKQALSVLNKTTPTHLLVSCAHFKIACVEAALGNLAEARLNLETAREIGELRRRGEDDGHIARMLWMRAKLLAAEPWELARRGNEPEVAAVQEQAEQMRTRLERADGLTGLPEAPDERTYDRLVCGYFR